MEPTELQLQIRNALCDFITMKLARIERFEGYPISLQISSGQTFVANLDANLLDKLMGLKLSFDVDKELNVPFVAKNLIINDVVYPLTYADLLQIFGVAKQSMDLIVGSAFLAKQKIQNGLMPTQTQINIFELIQSELEQAGLV